MISGVFCGGRKTYMKRCWSSFFDVEADPVTSGLADGSIVDISYRKYLIAVDL